MNLTVVYVRCTMCVMGAHRFSLLNQLLLALPEGFLADSAWLQAQGLSRSSIRDYVDRGWLERIASRVYRRPRQVANDPLRWDVVGVEPDIKVENTQLIDSDNARIGMISRTAKSTIGSL